MCVCVCMCIKYCSTIVVSYWFPLSEFNMPILIPTDRFKISHLYPIISLSLVPLPSLVVQVYSCIVPFSPIILRGISLSPSTTGLNFRDFCHLHRLLY